MSDSHENLFDFDACVKELPDSDSTKPTILLLSCLDYRFFGEIARRMAGKSYDHLILAGAALGAVVPVKLETWGQTFDDHVAIALKLHPSITKMWVMEHRQCGAYGPPPGFDYLPKDPDPVMERAVHMQQVEILRPRIPAHLEFSSFLLDVPTATGAWMCDKLI